MAGHVISLTRALRLESSAMVAFVGAGGKTSLIINLLAELSGVVATTTTRLSMAEVKAFPERVTYLPAQDEGILDASNRNQKAFSREELFSCVAEAISRSGSCLVVGKTTGDKAMGIPLDLPGELLQLDAVGYVLVEADGSRRLPCKAPGTHEPVIPVQTAIVIPTSGIDAVGRPIAIAAHRPERVAELVGRRLNDRLSAEDIVRLLAHPEGGLKGIPEKARVVPFINKVDDRRKLRKARDIARGLLREERIQRVLLGSARSKRPVKEIHRRITAVVLAAGLSTRMGTPKQFLPWGDSTVLGTTITNLHGSGVSEILVVSGYMAEEVQRLAAHHGAMSIFNERFDRGGLITSVQAALSAIPADRDAILVVLADQPMIKAPTIDRLLEVWWRDKGDLLAPAFGGRRGNPVLIGRRYFKELSDLPANSAPRELLQRHRQKLILVDVGTDSILADIDDENDYQRLKPRG